MSDVILSGALIERALTSQEVLEAFPKLKDLVKTAQPRKSGCCGGGRKSAHINQARAMILNMSSAQLEQLKTLLGFQPDQQMITYVRNNGNRRLAKRVL